MNRHDLEAQARWQAQAEQAERGLAASADDDPMVARYRLILRALGQPLALQLPADFAERVLANLGSHEEDASVEDWLATLLLLVLAVVGLFMVRPALADVLSHLSIKLPALPWPLVGATIAGIALAWAIDYLKGSDTLSSRR